MKPFCIPSHNNFNLKYRIHTNCHKSPIYSDLPQYHKHSKEEFMLAKMFNDETFLFMILPLYNTCNYLCIILLFVKVRLIHVSKLKTKAGLLTYT
jgi:hypothetical protein